MSAEALVYLMTQAAVWIVAVAITVAVLRWALRINEQIALQRAILEELRNQSSHSPASINHES